VALLDKRKEPGERCMLAVMTDGLENASREYTKETVKALLDRKQKEEGWLVSYLGAGHDAWAQANAMGLHAGNVAAFDKQAIGVSMAAIGARSKRYAMGDRRDRRGRRGCIGRLHRWGARRHAPNTKALTGEMRADPLPVRPLLASGRFFSQGLLRSAWEDIPRQSRRRRDVKRLMARRHCGFTSKCRLSKHSCRTAKRRRQKGANSSRKSIENSGPISDVEVSSRPSSLRPRLTPPQRRTLRHALANSIDDVAPTTY
jgi:hypothetical protein